MVSTYLTNRGSLEGCEQDRLYVLDKQGLVGARVQDEQHRLRPRGVEGLVPVPSKGRTMAQGCGQFDSVCSSARMHTMHPHGAYVMEVGQRNQENYPLQL